MTILPDTRSYRALWRDHLQGDWVVILLMAGAAAVTMLRYVRAVIREPNIPYDYPTWHHVANVVLDGTPLYVHPAVDNKPPLFELLQIGAAATGNHLFALFALTALVNMGIVAVTYVLGSDYSQTTARVAALFVTASLPAMDGIIPTVRAFGVLFLLFAILSRGPYRTGALVAVAGQFTQFAVFALPWFIYRHRDTDWLARAAVAGIAVTGGSYALVGGLWGLESIIGAVDMTILNAWDYSSRPLSNPFYETGRYVGQLLNVVSATIFLQVPFAIGLLRGDDTRRLGLLSILLLTPLLIKSFPHYWLLPLPFMAIIGAREIESWVSRE